MNMLDSLDVAREELKETIEDKIKATHFVHYYTSKMQLFIVIKKFN